MVTVAHRLTAAVTLKKAKLSISHRDEVFFYLPLTPPPTHPSPLTGNSTNHAKESGGTNGGTEASECKKAP